MIDSARRPVFLCALTLTAAALLAYHNSFSVPFLFDDLPAIVGNPTIRHLWPITDVLSPPANGATVSGRPLLNLSFALNYALSGTGVRSYHALNLAIHLLAALTLFGLVRRTLLQPLLRSRFGAASLPLAFSAALLWTVHPLQTESVTYLAQRAESLAGLFLLLTLYAFIRSHQCHLIGDIPSGARSRVWLVLAWCACLAGVATKEIGAVAPLLVLLYDRTFVAGSFRAAWQARKLFYLGLIASWALLAGLVFSANSRGGTAGFGAGIPWWDYALTQCYAVVHYLRLALWPHPLVFDYGMSVVNTLGEVALPLAVLVMLGAATLFALRRRPALGFLGCWFFVILAPSSSVVPIVSQTIAEHRVYLPLAALTVAAVLALQALIGHWTALACAGLGLACAWGTVQRNVDYRSALAIWSDTAGKQPDNPRAHFNVGLLLAEQGDSAGAEKSFRAALAIDARNAEVHINLGNLLAEQHRLPDAMNEFAEAIRLAPASPVAHFSAANALAQSGQIAAATTEYERTLQLRPDYALAHNNLGNILLVSHRAAEAIPHYAAALRSDPASASAHYNLANALAQTGQTAEAVTHYEEALRLKPDYADAHHNLAALLAAPGRAAEAQPLPREAARLTPATAPGRTDPQAEIHNNRGNELFQQGRTPEAIAEYQEALRRQPGLVQVRINLGNALAAAGRVPEAIKSYEEALQLQPDNADAHFALGNALAQTDRLAPAGEEYQKVLRLRPDDIDAHNNLGNIFLLSGRVPDAIREYREVLRLRPDDANARTNLEQALALPPSPTRGK